MCYSVVAFYSEKIWKKNKKYSAPLEILCKVRGQIQDTSQPRSRWKFENDFSWSLLFFSQNSTDFLNGFYSKKIWKKNKKCSATLEILCEVWGPIQDTSEPRSRWKFEMNFTSPLLFLSKFDGFCECFLLWKNLKKK